MTKKTIICLDRDGTLIHDNKYHLGRTNDWKSKVKILPKVIEGIKLLYSLPNTRLYMITNQPGVAINDFPLLTFKRAHTVCQYVLRKLKEKGAELNGYFLCPHASPDYVKKRKTRNYEKKLVCNCDCIKPRLGMVFDALRSENITREESNIYIVGDRESDVQTALNVNGTGIFVPFQNEKQEIKKIKALKEKQVYIAKDFLDVAEYIVKKEKNL